MKTKLILFLLMAAMPCCAGTWTLNTWITPVRTYCDDPTGGTSVPSDYLACTRSICNDSVGFGTGNSGACTPPGLAAGLAGVLAFVNNDDTPSITPRQINTIYMCATLSSGICNSSNNTTTVTIWHAPMQYTCPTSATTFGGGTVSVDCATFTSVGGEKYWTTTRTDNGQKETMGVGLWGWSTSASGFIIDSIATQADNFKSGTHTMVSPVVTGNDAIAQWISTGVGPSATLPYVSLDPGTGHFGYAYVANVTSATVGLDPTWTLNPAWSGAGIQVSYTEAPAFQPAAPAVWTFADGDLCGGGCMNKKSAGK